MDIKTFEEISLYLGVGGLMLFMMFIIYDLGKNSDAGKFGMMILFIGLGLGLVGFIAKSVIQSILGI